MTKQTTAEKVVDWFMTGDVGASSKTIAMHMMGKPLDIWNSHPRDGGDFGRCEALLKAVPEFRSRLPEMTKLSPYWAALVPRWAEIKAAPDWQKYELMCSILRPIEERDSKTVRIGGGVTMRFK